MTSRSEIRIPKAIQVGLKYFIKFPLLDGPREQPLAYKAASVASFKFKQRGALQVSFLSFCNWREVQSDYVQLEWGKLSLTFRIKLTGIQTTTTPRSYTIFPVFKTIQSHRHHI